MTTCGRLFQRRLPATGMARSPTVMSRVRRISNDDDGDERRLRHCSWRHVGNDQRDSEERDRAGIHKQARLT